jgi:phage N-6-adenine-methyltransferase
MSLVGFRAKNHPQQTAQDCVDDRAILHEHFYPLNAKYRFTIDAAASAENAVLLRYWTKEDDALAQRWTNERVWCNPPYSDMATWVKKAWAEMYNGGCELIVMLVSANRTEQGWWQQHVEPFRDRRTAYRGVTLRTEFQATRWRFKWPADRIVPPKGDRPPFGLALLIWERHLGTPCCEIRP